MSTFKFVIRTDVPKQDGTCKIYLKYTHQSKWFNIPTGENVHPNHWDSENGCPKRSHPYKNYLETDLNVLKESILKLKNQLTLEEKEVSVDNLKMLIKMKKSKVKSKLDFKEGWEKYINTKKGDITKSTLTVYNVTYKHLTNYCSISNSLLSYTMFDIDFESSWNIYFYENDISNSTNGKYFKTLKTFLHWSYDRYYLKNNSFKKYKVKQSEPEIHPLHLKEVEKISKFINISNKGCTESERRVGSMLLFMCHTSLRFSDLQRLDFTMIHRGDKGYKDGGYIRMDTQKTDVFITVPITDSVFNEISRCNILFGMGVWGMMFETDIEDSLTNVKPETKVFPKISNQKFNEYIKTLCQKVGLIRPVKIIKKVGSDKRENYVPLWKTVGTHTGRRTFVTTSLQKGITPEILMCITGHSDYRTMKRYIKMNKSVVVEKTNEVLNNKKETTQEELLKKYSKRVEEMMNKVNDSQENQTSNVVTKNNRDNPWLPPH